MDGVRKRWFLAAACLLLLMLAAFLAGKHKPRKVGDGVARVVSERASPPETLGPSERWKRRTAHPTEARLPEQIVHEKVAKFAQSRRELAEKLGKRHGVSITPEIDAFFAALESGEWERIEKTFAVINGGDSSAGHAKERAPEVSKMWPAIIDAYGVAEQAHLMPPKTLLEYGYSILDSLSPGMVYVGGTDSSRWVPALLNDTEQGDRHIVITQNGLADSTYLEYVTLQFADRMNTLSDDESHALYDVYAADAVKRLQHDQKFPDEPKQVRRAEDVKVVDGKPQISGRDAVFEMNERLLKKLMEKNPGLSFAIGESIPLPGTYADALPLGPLMELRADPSETFNAARASESVQYWREKADSVLADPESAQSEYALRTYSHDASASGNLLAARGFHAEAEQAYRLSQRIFPGSPEAAVNLAKLYQRTGRSEEGQTLLKDFVREHPSERKTLREHWGIEIENRETK